MATKRLKILIAVMSIILIFMLGFNAWHGEDIITEMQVEPVVETGSVASWDVKEIETVIYTWEDTKKIILNEVN